MSARDNANLVHSLFDAINRRDVDHALGLVDENVEWMNMATGEVFHGQEGFRRALGGWWTGFPDNNVEILDLIPGEDAATVEYVATGTNSGPLHLPSGRIPPTAPLAIADEW